MNKSYLYMHMYVSACITNILLIVTHDHSLGMAGSVNTS